MWLTVGFEDEDVNTVPASPDSTPLDLSPNMAAAEAPPPEGKFVIIPAPKTDPDQTLAPDPDPERSADREAVALAMVTDLNKATGIIPLKRDLIPEVEEAGAPARKKQRKRPREDEKICLVCGDKALAHNFDAITCESCKAFFRRNALRFDSMKCMFTGECEITIQTRRFCPACRLKKCFTIGMRADLILDDSERKARMDKVSENRAKRMAKDGSDVGDPQVGSSSSSGQVITMVSLPNFTSGSRHPTPPTSSSSSSLPVSTTTTTTTSSSTTHSSVGHDDRASPRLQQLVPPTQRPSSSSQQQRRRTSAESGRNGLSTLHAVLTAAVAATVPEVGASPVLNVPVTGYHHPPQKTAAQSSVVSPPPPPHLPHTAHQMPAAPAPSQNPANVSNGSSSNSNSSGGGGCRLPPERTEFQHVPRDVLPSDPHMYWRLSEEEKTLLTQLSSAYQATIMTLPERVPFEGSLFQMEQSSSISLRSIEHIFETSEKNMRQIINFVQRLGDFHLLREDDKIAVLQASCMRSVILRWTGLYVVERNTWLTRFGECTVNTASVIFGHEDVIKEMAGFCCAMKTILKNDVTLFVLTHCLILFDAREQNLVDRQLISTFRDKYLILLKHYLEAEYSFLFSERYLQAVLGKVMEIRQVADKCMGIMKEFQDFIPPLTKQLLNLQEVR